MMWLLAHRVALRLSETRHGPQPWLPVPMDWGCGGRAKRVCQSALQGDITLTVGILAKSVYTFLLRSFVPAVLMCKGHGNLGNVPFGDDLGSVHDRGSNQASWSGFRELTVTDLVVTDLVLAASFCGSPRRKTGRHSSFL